MKPMRSLLPLGWLAGILMLAACRHESVPPTAAELPLLPVTTATVIAVDVAQWEQLPGVVRPVTSALLEAKATGRVMAVTARPGDIVERDRLLVELDAPEWMARAEEARAALTLAEQEFERITRLHARQAATAAELDAATSARRRAAATLAQAESLLAYTRVTAPFEGVVARRMAEPGDLAMPGKPLLELEVPGQLRLEVDVPEALIDGVEPDTTLEVVLGTADRVVSAKVGEIHPAGDPTSLTFRVKLDLPPGTAARSGQFGRLRLPRGRQPVLLVPTTAVVHRGQLEQVFVVADGTARLRLVKTGPEHDGQVSILAGVEAGEIVVTMEAPQLRDGQPVEPRP